MFKIGEDTDFYWYCTFEGSCSCLYDENGKFDGKPALEDCIYCDSLVFRCKQCEKELNLGEANTHKH